MEIGTQRSLFYPVAEDFKGACHCGHHCHLIDHAAGKVGLHKAGGLNGRDLDFALTLAAQRFRQILHAHLCDLIHACARNGEVGVDGGDINHLSLSLLDHLVIDGGDAENSALDADVDALFPFVQRLLMLTEKGQRHRPGVVNKHIDPAVGIYREFSHCENIVLFRHVCYDVAGLPP